jgi:superfamily II DNA helicase RecQ
VWPDQIPTHLKQKHKITRKDGVEAAKAIRQEYGNMAESPNEFIGPSITQAQIPQLRVFTDGFQCHECGAIRKNETCMRKHCRQEHGRTMHTSCGRPSKAKQNAIVNSGNGLWSKIERFQRFFNQGEHSNYFKVHEQRGQQEHRVDEPSDETQWAARVNGELDEIWRKASNIRKKADRIIEEGETDEVNKWVDRTKWNRYLKGYEHEALLDLIEKPEEEEQVEDAMWTAMGGLAKFCQKTVAQKAGLFVRFEAVRSEKQQTRYVPLMAYQDYKAIGTYTRPWQRVLMFFARTRKAEARKVAPKYRLTGRQEEAWVQFIREAKKEIREAGREPKKIDPKKKHKKRRSRDDAESEEEDQGQGHPEEAEQEELTATQRACLRFCMALLDQRNIDHDYDSALVCGLAVLGVGETGWKGVDAYPPILSKLIKIARFMVVQQAFDEVQPADEFAEFEDDGKNYGSEEEEEEEEEEDGNGEEAGWTEVGNVGDIGDWLVVDGENDAESDDQAHEATPDEQYSKRAVGKRYGDTESVDVSERPESRHGVIDAVAQRMDRFMVRGTNGPMQWMLDLRTYGLKIHYNTTSPGHVDWEDNEVLKYRGIHIRMDAFRGFVGTLLQQAQKLMNETLLMGYETPAIPWSNIRDDASNSSPRFNFLRDEHSRMPADGEMWLRRRMGDDIEKLKQWYKPGAKRVDMAQLDKYMAAVKEFRMQLLILMHITGGQPARAPEILSVRHENTVKGNHRNLFVEDGLVVFVTRYHKGYAMSGDIKIIHRYLPREVSELVVRYLWLVLPFHFAMEREHFWSTPEEGEAPKPVSSHLWPVDHEGRKTTSTQMREAMKRYSREHLGQTLTIQSYREIAIAISRRFIGEQDAFMNDFDGIDEGGLDEGEGEQGVGRRLQAIMDKQASHTSSVAGMIYARLISERDGTVASTRARFRTVSCMWHLWLGFDTAFDHEGRDGGQTMGKRKTSEVPWEAVMEAKQAARWKHLRGADIQTGLQQMMRSGAARFRGVQREAIQAIVEGAPRIIAVMPTGEGKSLLFQLPAYISPRGLTVVVVPLVALRYDMMIRCAEIGVRAREWEADRQVDDASIVFVTPETAAQNASFRSFAQRNRRRLDRIVIDECHVVLNESTTFRRHLQRLGGLVKMASQMIMVTATLPVSKTETLKRNMFWSGLVVREFRMRTARTNIRYSVCTIDGSEREHDEAVVRVVEAKFRQYQPGKMIVYCNSTSGVSKYADMLGVDAYFSDADLKAEKFSDFRNGRTQLIVATSALGLGIDIPDIRAVIHVDWPFGMIEFSQEGGRAGRDRQASENIVIMRQDAASDRKERFGGKRHGAVENTALIERFMQIGVPARQQSCRRIVLNEYFDGEDGQACRQGEEACDVCSPSADLQRAIAGVTEAASERAVQDNTRDDRESATVFTTGVVSFRGTEEVSVDDDDVQAFRESQHDRGRAKEAEVERTRNEQTQTRQIKSRLEEWRGKCVLCAIDGRAFDHSAWRCEHVQSCGAYATARLAQKSTRLEGKFSCTMCFTPQSMCHWFAPHPSKAGWYVPARTGGGRVCPYNGMVVMAFACAIHSSEGPYHRRQFAGDASADGLCIEDIETQVVKPEAWDGKSDGPVVRYMGGEVRLNDERMCRWCVVFNNTIRRVEELQASRAGARRARREGP